ncbi:KH domain-containing protein [Candidatus Poriferisocius sp.]|uniref:KH domain-containing protein n=1 Tax=Candidatus Poriferisocius sp. TaxID=3101276 RepID=UPI003B5BE335
MSDTDFDTDDDQFEDDDYNHDDDLADDDLHDDDDDINTIEVPTARNVLEYLVKALVEHPDGVDIEVVERRGSVTLEVTVAEGDMGRVIGRRGRVANSIRAVVRAAASKDGSSVDVEFVD